jgi:hypothetical protein
MKSSHCVMLCELVSRKITNLDYCRYYRNPFSEMSYHVQSSMAFKPNELGHDQNHGIICSNDPMLCTCMPLGMENNVYFVRFPFPRIKSSFSISWVSKRGFLWRKYKEYKLHQPNLKKILDLILCTNHQLVMWPKVSIHLSRKRQGSTNSAGSRANWNYKCITVWSWYFTKIIFRFLSHVSSDIHKSFVNFHP